MRIRQTIPAAKQLLPVGAGSIFAFVGAAFLQDRHDQFDETLQTLRNNGARQVEAVDIGLLDPGDHLVRDLLWRTDYRRLAAAEHEPIDQPALRPARAERGGDGLD